MRHVLPLLLFAAVTAGQGVDDWIDTALDPRTAPEQRVEALKKVAQSKEALDRLAEKGLDGKRDPEVVHAVVDTLLKANDYRPYLERMCRLLPVEKHRDKVLQRFQSLWEADRGQALLDGCIAMARETNDPLLKEAAIVALTRIPRRRATETIVEVGLAAAEEPVRSAARAYVQRLLGVPTLREAAVFLQEHKLDSFQDFVWARIDALIAKEKEDEDRTRRFLEKATAAEALEELERGGAYRLFAAQRIGKLAEENGIKDAAEFARRILNGVVAELSCEAPDPRVLAPLLSAVQRYASDPNGALWQTSKPKDVRDTLQRLADLQGSGQEHQNAGSTAVRLLGAIDDEGIALNAFAERYPSIDVRKEAIQQLGQLAHRRPEQRNYVGIKLAALLVGAEKEPAIRAQILNVLTQPHVPVATEPADVGKVVRGFLEKGATPDLTDAELRDCTIVLGKRRTPEAKEALLKAASSHEKLQVRRYALEEGLVPWARVDESIHDQLKALALSQDQPLEARKAVVEALGKRGWRRAEATLRVIEESDGPDSQLRPALREARLQLLKRLANGEGAAADALDQKPADLEAAGRLLEQGILGDPDAERMEPLAAALVKACDLAKQPAYTARYRLAWLYARLPAGKGNEAELLRRYEDARANAAADRLPPALRDAMLTECRELLLKAPGDKERVAKAVRCTADLAELALDGKDKGKAASCYLDAAECAYRLLGDGPLAMDLLDKAKTTGGLGGEMVAREADLRAKVEQLPKPS